MVLDAYYKQLATQIAGGNPNGYTFKDYAGSVREFDKNSATNYLGNVAISGICFMYTEKVYTTVTNIQGVVFGDGSEAVSKDDYKLSGDVITTISASASVTSEHEDGQGKRITLYTITNTGSNAITISEIGYYGLCLYRGSYVPALLERTVLENPVTIEPVGVAQITYTITFNYPTA